MLKIQEFIFNHPENWRELLSSPPYCLKISEEDGYVLFKYNQIESDFSEEICCEARGLILDSTNNFKVVRFAFEKFFNLGEPHAATIDWQSAVATEKIDGSLISVWWGRNKWHVSTNSTIDAFKAPLDSIYSNFGLLFAVAAMNSGFSWEPLIKGYCYTFELVSRYNQVVIKYDEPKLYHICTRLMASSFPEMGQNIGVEKPKSYYANSEKDFVELVNNMNEEHEGVVVKDRFGNRVKIKTKTYFQLHKMRNNGNINIETIVELIRTNEHHEFLAYFPEFKPYFSQIEENLEVINTLIEEIIAEVKSWYNQHPVATQKDFALAFKDSPNAPLYFMAAKHHLRATVEAMSTKKFISFFNIHLTI